MESTAVHRIACALLVRENTALLAFRSAAKTWYPSVWDLPGGHIEPGESAQQALARELLEELGITVVPPTSGPVLRLHGPGEDVSIWRIDEWLGTVSNTAPEEHDVIGWFTLDESRTLHIASPAYRGMLERELS